MRIIADLFAREPRGLSDVLIGPDNTRFSPLQTEIRGVNISPFFFSPRSKCGKRRFCPT